MDIKTPEERSKNMAAVKSRNTKPELRLRRAIWKAGLRYFTAQGWTNLTGVFLPGSPDLIFPASRIVLFVDGCFWHGCPEHYHAPEERKGFWAAKLKENLDRDRRVSVQLREKGWDVLRIWEHDLKTGPLNEIVHRLKLIIHSKLGQIPTPPQMLSQSDASIDRI